MATDRVNQSAVTMQLGILLAVLASILVSENAPAEAVEAAPWRVCLVVAGSLSAVLLAGWGSWAITSVMRADDGGSWRWEPWFVRLQRSYFFYWCTTVALAIYGLRWPQLVRYNWGLDNAILLRDLTILTPVWLPLLCSWAAFYQVEREALRRQVPGGVVRPSRAAFVWLRARHYLGLCLLPVTLLLAFQDLIVWWRPSWQQSEYAWLLYLLPLVVMTLFLPQLLSWVWDTTPLSAGPLRGRLEQLAARLRVRVRSFRVWQTQGQLLNAAVTGFVPAVRCVFLTDGLLDRLCDEEVEAILAHELGHIRRKHLWLRVLLLALPIWVLGNVQALAPQWGEQCGDWLLATLGGQTVVHALVVPALTIAYTVLALGSYSRMLEHDADLCVYETGRAVEFCTTLDRLACLTQDDRHRRTWLHPSTASRVHLLQQAMRDPQQARAWRRRVDFSNCLLIAAWLATPLCVAGAVALS